VFKISSKID